jgi:transcriptional regulator with XRE-family HTH domain
MKEVHGWLRGALTDRGLVAKDVAKRWGVTDGVVSRFIKTGDPEPGISRITALADLLNMTDGELIAQLREGLAPPRRAAPEPARVEPAESEIENSVEALLDELKECAAKVRAALPGYRVTVRVELLNGETP